MANALIGDLVTEVSKDVTVMKSATTLINGFNQRLTDAIAAAVANGATADELAPLSQLKTDLDTSSTDLATSVAANTPAAPKT